MAITYFNSASNPADNGTSAASPVSVTPPGSMAVDDLVLVILYARNATATFGISNAGGQTWTAQATHQSSTAVLSAAFYWCVFNGTWSANPAWTFSSTTNTNAVMHVFRPSAGGNTWALDPFTSPGFPAATGESNGLVSYAATTTPKVSTSVQPTNDSTINLMICMSDDDNTWAISGFATGRAGSAQYRNTSGSDVSSVYAYLIRTAASPYDDSLAAGQFQQLTLGGDPGIKGSFTFYETASGGGGEDILDPMGAMGFFGQ